MVLFQNLLVDFYIKCLLCLLLNGMEFRRRLIHGSISLGSAASTGGELQHRAAAAMAAGGSGWRAEGRWGAFIQGSARPG
jgi:hypothetical protein